MDCPSLLLWVVRSSHGYENQVHIWPFSHTETALNTTTTPSGGHKLTPCSPHSFGAGCSVTICHSCQVRFMHSFWQSPPFVNRDLMVSRLSIFPQFISLCPVLTVSPPHKTHTHTTVPRQWSSEATTRPMRSGSTWCNGLNILFFHISFSRVHRARESKSHANNLLHMAHACGRGWMCFHRRQDLRPRSLPKWGPISPVPCCIPLSNRCLESRKFVHHR